MKNPLACRTRGRLSGWGPSGRLGGVLRRKSRRRFGINLQKKRFWLADENRWITLNVSTQGLRLIDKIGIRKVLNRMRADGKKV